MRAVIDIGTNSVLLLVGNRREDGGVDVELDRSTITRLGEGVAEASVMRPEAIERTLDVLAGYRATAEEHGAELTAVATAGLRMAKNRADFLGPASARLGVDVRVLSGDEEAELSYLSVARERPEGQPLRVLDIGGGSTELVVGEGTNILERRSHAIGSVRLTEELVADDPPPPAAIAALEAAAREAFAAQPLEPHKELCGLAGTVTTAAALLLRLRSYDREAVDGSRFASEAVLGLRDRLAGQSLHQRMAHSVLEPRRADVIIAGLTILWIALRHCGADTLLVRDRGLRYALL